MTSVPRTLPSQFSAAPFTVANALQAGLTRRTLQNPRFGIPHHGVRKLLPAPETISPTETTTASETQSRREELFDERRALSLAQEYFPLLRTGEAFSHTTALLLLQVPVRTSPALHVTIPLPHGQARGRNVIGHRTRIPFEPHHGQERLPCMPLARAIVQSASLLSFRELVVALDVHLRSEPSVQRTLATDAASRFDALVQGSARGARRLRAALQVTRVGAESRMETLLHFELARMGIDTLELQADIFDQQGRWIGRFDQLDRRTKKILEYDGEQHRTSRAQYLKDEQRLELARQAGFSILRLHSEDLQDNALETTREQLCQYLGRAPRPIPRALVPFFDEPLNLS